MRTTAFALLSLVGALTTSCLDDPIPATCGDFPLDGTPECPAPCETYCDEMMVFCPDTFGSEEACLRECEPEPTAGAVVPNGNLGDTTGNTLSCRITAAQEDRCEDAGLAGSEACGCSQYCSDMMSACPGAYPSAENCLASCALFPIGRRVGSDQPASENSLLCRERFAASAVVEPNPSACNAASFGGGGTCGDVCAFFCQLENLHCTGADQVFDSPEQCLDLCRLMNTDGNFDDWQFDKEIDSIQCRIYHAGPPAALDPAVHCPHTRVYNIEHCGVVPLMTQQDNWPCQTFCDVTQRNCPGVYVNRAACITDCSRFPELMNLADDAQPAIYPISSTVCPTR